MTQSYNQTTLSARLRKLGLAALLAAGVGAAHGQNLAYSAANVRKSIGTFTDISGTGTAIATANTDDATSAAIPLGIPFSFAGAARTTFFLNTNGYIRLDAAPTAPFFNDSGNTITGGPLDGTDTNLIMPFNADLTAGTAGGTVYHYAVSGTSPNRVLTIQWKNVKDKARTAGTGTAVGVQYNNFSFQVKLYETSNQIDFVYGTATPAPAANDAPKFINVGLKGGTAATQRILGSKSSGTAWVDATFAAAAYTTIAFDIRVAVLPEPGRTYSFTIPVANDGAVQAVYGYNQLAIPAAQPVTLRAAIRNAGTNALSNVVATLTLTGPTATPYTATQTVNALALNATSVVNFAAVPVPLAGTYTVTVSIANDGNNANNSASMTMVANATTISYITPNTPPASAFGFATGAVDLYFGAKATLTQGRDLTSVDAFFFNEPAAVGAVVYGVVVDATTGTLVARSADFTVTTASLNSLHTFPMPAVNMPAGDYVFGMVTNAGTTTAQYFLMSVQSEVPSRTGSFFTGSATSGNPPTESLSSPAGVTAGNNIYKYMLQLNTAPPATCPTPTAITVGSVTSNTASVSFTGPTNGTAYQVVAVPTGSPVTGGTPVSGTGSPIALSGLTAGQGYDVYVRANCGATDQSVYAGPVFFSTPCAPPIITAFPYAQGFDVIARGQDLPCGIAVSDDNADGFTWEPINSLLQGTTTVPVTRNTSAFAMVYLTNSDGITGADDWFYLPAMRFAVGSRYRLSFYYRNNSTNAALNEAMEVKYGNAATAAAQTNTLWSKLDIGTRTYMLANNASTPVVMDITPTANGLNYIGFHCISQPDRQFLAVDDVNIGLLAVSGALAHAVTVYPNPSNTGRFTLDVSGANAKTALQVEVTNMLGQRVYTSTAKDNFSNDLNLSGLAAGIYSLKVRNGAEYMQQQISIVK